MANADKGNIEVINGSIGDLIFRIETLTSDRDTIKVCVRAANELTAMTNHINSLTESNARLQATYDHVEEINLRYAELIQSLQNDSRLADMAWTDNQATLKNIVTAIEDIKIYCNNPSAWEHYDDGVSEKIRAILKAAGMA